MATILAFIALVAVSSVLAPQLTRRDIFFGVTVAPGFRDGDVARSISRRYAIEVWFLAAVVRSVDRPVNVLMGLPHVALDRAALSARGVRRISIGSALARAAYGELLRGAREMGERGTFTFADRAASSRDVTALLESGGAGTGPEDGSPAR